jgi:di/tricarboxylate transporter
MITIGALFIVVGGVEKSHVVDWLARKTFGTDGSVLLGKVRMYVTCFCLSIFFNNTPLVAILMPVVKDWGRMRNIAASQLLMPLSYSVLAGSFISMIGTSTNLTVQGLMQADRGYSFHFFAPAPIGIVCFVGVLAYQIIAGPYLLPDEKVGLIRTARDKAASMMAEVYVAPDSRAVGKSVGEVMNSLGVAPSSMIKIRRRVEHTGLADAEGSPKPSASRFGVSIVDVKYIKKYASSWVAKGAKALTGASAATEEAEEEKIRPSEIVDAAEYTDIIAPAYHELVAAHDVLFVSSAQDVVEKMMKSIAGESKGLFILNSNAMDLPGFGSELLECVVSDTNPFLGKTVKEFQGEFAEKYKAGLITVRGKDWFDEEEVPAAATAANEKAGGEDADAGAAVELTAISTDKKGYTTVGAVETSDVDLEKADGVTPATNADNSGATVLAANPAVVVSDHVLTYGDIILCVSRSKEVENITKSRDFFVVSTVGSLPKPLTFYKSIPVAIFIAMLIIVATENIDMCSASLTVATVFLLGGWVKTKEIPDLVDVKLLLLIGSSISFAKAVTKTGLALEVAQTISDSSHDPLGMMFLIYALTLVITELISNNAAAALMYPIAVALADEIGADFKPFAMCVLVASTAGFMSPIGYQTHMMVWAPGGYKFKDFVIFGFIPDIIYWVISCLLIPAVFPF